MQLSGTLCISAPSVIIGNDRCSCARKEVIPPYVPLRQREDNIYEADIEKGIVEYEERLAAIKEKKKRTELKSTTALTVGQLKEMLQSVDIKFKSNTKKAQLESLLKEYETKHDKVLVPEIISTKKKKRKRETQEGGLKVENKEVPTIAEGNHDEDALP